MKQSTYRRQTKIIWSFKSKALNQDLAKVVATSDPDAIRLIYTPGTDDKLLSFLKAVRRFEGKKSRLSAVIDIAPQARGKVVGIDSPVELEYGATITFVPAVEQGSKPKQPKSVANQTRAITEFQVEAAEWGDLFADNATVFLGYGNVVLKILSLNAKKVKCEVLQGGSVHPRMELHIPTTRSAPSLSHLTDIKLKEFSGVGVDYVVLPGLVAKREIQFIRKRIEAASGEMPWMILKVDNKAVYENLETLLPLVDGVMISRRELALTMEPACIPMITKEITQKCNNHAKLVLIASEILGSMRYNPTPTRAEVSDIANCVMDGADAVVLSEDIGKGIYPEKALEVCKNVIKDIEENETISRNWTKQSPSICNEYDAVSSQAYQTANRLGVKAIVCLTKAGNTALKLSSFRQQKPIIALTFSEQVNRRLSLVRGVDGVCLDVDPNLDEVLPAVNDLLKLRSQFKAGDKYVFVTVTLSSVGKEASNLFTVQQIN